MFSRFASGAHNPRLLTVLFAASVLLVTTHTGRAQVSCQDFDPQCQANGVCQADGSCKGEPLPSSTGCNDGDPCTINDHCDGSGTCVGGGNASNTTSCDDGNDCTINDHCDGAGTCVGGGNKGPTDSCTFAGLGTCATGTCLILFPGIPPICNATPKDCGDKCHFCNPSTGECQANTFCGLNPCSTGACDPSTGECVAGNEGAHCDDGNVCTSNDLCHSGLCQGSAGGTPQPTATPGSQTPSPTSGPSECVGDCNSDRTVTVDEIITMVNIALGNAPVTDCEAGDANLDGQITVDEIVTAVNNALNGCPIVENSPTPLPTNTSPPPPTNTSAPPTTTHVPATPTATQNPLTPSPTSGPPTSTPSGGTPSIGTRASGTIESTTETFQVFPNLISALIGHLPGAGAGGAASLIPPQPFSCDSGGGTVSCDQTITITPPFFTPPVYTVTLNSCQVAGPSGNITVNGTLTIADQQAEACLASIPTSATVTAQNLTIQMPNGTTATFTGFSAGLGLSCNSGSCSCFADTATLQPVGSITVSGNGTSTQIAFGDGSSVSLSVAQFKTPQCVPTVYDMQIDGNITLTTGTNVFAATYAAYTIHDDATSGHDMVEVSGDVNSACFGDTVTFSTETDIALGNPCPSAGVVDAFANTSGNTDTITYSASGVHIDFGAGGSTDFSSCLDPGLFACPAG